MLAYKQLPPEIWDGLTTLLGWLGWFVMAAMILRLMFIAGALWVRGGDSDGAAGLLMVVSASVVAGAAGGIAGLLLLPP